METFNLYSGQRILFKERNGWEVGNLCSDGAHLCADGLFFDVMDNNKIIRTMVPYDNLFTHARKLEEWETSYLYSKEHFLQLVEDDELSSKINDAWMSDGEYAYYTVGKWNKNWIDKQPFEYVYCV